MPMLVVFLFSRERSAAQTDPKDQVEPKVTQESAPVQQPTSRPSLQPKPAPRLQTPPLQTTLSDDPVDTPIADRRQRANQWASALNGLGWNIKAIDIFSRRHGTNQTMDALAPFEGQMYQVRVSTQTEYDKMLTNSNLPNARQFIGRWNEFVELILYIEQANPRVVTGVSQFASPTDKTFPASDPAVRAAEIAAIMRGWGWNFQSQIIGLQFDNATQNVICSFEGRRYQVPAYTQAGFHYFMDLKIRTLRGANRTQAELLKQRYHEFIELLLYI